MKTCLGGKEQHVYILMEILSISVSASFVCFMLFFIFTVSSTELYEDLSLILTGVLGE